jgi:hypothetical protein
MKFMYFAIMVISIFTLTITAAAQDKAVNFAGTWELDVSKSKLGDRSNVESQTLTVKQSGKEISVQTQTKRTPRPADAPQGGQSGRMGGRMGGGFGGGDDAVTYPLDGKETKTEFEGRMGKMPGTLKGTVEGGRLHLASSRTFNGPNGELTMITKEKWELSADGKTLTINSERSTPRGNESTTKIFIKKS